jgi:predicted AAA+ superfamily ATPase
MIHWLYSYHGNRASRLIKSPKLYFSDSGLAAYLAGLTDSSALRQDPLYGALFETYAAHNLQSIIDARWPNARLHFWAVQGRHEVDFVIEAGRACMAVEVKATVRWDERDLSGLKAFLNATPHCKAAILAYGGKDPVRLGDRLWAIPLDLLLS